MINLSDYPLTFHHNETKKAFPARRTMDATYVLIDLDLINTNMEPKIKITEWFLKKNFKSDPKNKKRRGVAFRKCKKISA